MLAGQTSVLAQLISLVENDSPELGEIIQGLRPHLGKAYRIGITGPPGGGKSTVVCALTTTIRSKELSVGIIAVDPSSPISGGSLLGDRIRMNRLYLDEGVFIRSMATRGCPGGLSKAVAFVIDLLDAFGKDIIIVETAGVGQTELGIREVVDTVVLVLVPGYGDGIQVMKAGLIELADIIAVNKVDPSGAEWLVDELRDKLASRQVVIATEAISGAGIEKLYQAICQQRQNNQTDG